MAQQQAVPGRIVQLRVTEDRYMPAIVVGVNSGGTVNLRAFADEPEPSAEQWEAWQGSAGGWFGSVSEGTAVREWRWPTRV